MTDRDYLSIGEVLAQLLEEFPDVTISKIRFLESQGLIEPERTPSGYRKFTLEEVERLRFILREQRTNYTPLRIIKTRLEDESTDISRDFTLPHQVVSTSGHPAARGSVPRPKDSLVSETSIPEQDPLVPQSLQREQRREALTHKDNTESIPRDQLVQQHKIDPVFLKELESAGLISGHEVGDTTFFDAASIEVAKAASRFKELGIEVRHLRAWKSSADREVNLYEQRILPLLRQRNPASREEALNMLNEFSILGGDLRNALIMRDIIRLTEQR
ncbi:MAG: MerR family transcriptional regulator [Ilumatobacteraceae bacterium]